MAKGYNGKGKMVTGMSVYRAAIGQEPEVVTTVVKQRSVEAILARVKTATDMQDAMLIRLDEASDERKWESLNRIRNDSISHTITVIDTLRELGLIG